MGIGAAAMAGWLLGIPALTRAHHSLVTMKANMALCLMLGGAALWLLQDEEPGRTRRRVAQGCAAVIVLLGALTLTEHVAHVDLGIDMMIVRESRELAGKSFPGRFGPVSAIVLMLSGSALILMDWRTWIGRYPTPYLASAGVGITFLVCLGSVYGAGGPQPLSHYISIGLNTVVAFLFLCTGILWARPHRSLMGTCLSPHAGGFLARGLLPAAFILPGVLGWLRVAGEKAGWYDPGMGTALFATSLIAVFALLVARTARSLNLSAASRLVEEESLRVREQELADCFQSAAIGMHWVGPEGTILRVNAAELAMLGYREDEYVGRRIEEFHADAEQFQDIMRRLLAGETLVDHPARLLCKDGSIRDVLIHVSGYSKHGRFVHSRCFTRDVTELKRVANALEQSEQRYRSLVELSPDAVLVNQDDKVVFANPAAQQILGPNIFGTSPLKRVHPSSQRQVKERVLQLLELGQAMPTLQEKWVREDGRLIDVEVSAVRINWGDRHAIHVVLRDVTERAQAEERFRFLAEVVSLQVWTARLDGELDFANQEWADYLGVGVEDILGSSWARFVHEEDLPAVLEAWQKSLASGERYEVEFRLRGKGGAYRWFLVRAAAMRDSDGQITRWFGTNTEIHELKTAQAEAERASRSKDAFLAALSHELRTPLNPVLMMAAALREDGRLPEEVREQLGMMERNIALEARLIDDLLDLTSIARGRLRLQIQWCDAHSLINLAIEIVREEAQAKAIRLESEFTARHSGLHADPARFQQVIWNLLRNAVKFTPRDGRIVVRTQDLERDRLCIAVSDSGIGIDPAVIERIFQPFDQGGLTGDHRFGGMGLGLSIARTVVDLHGGQIRAESAGRDQGATFTVELPVAAGSQGAGDQGPPGVVATAGTGTERAPCRLLLVDDHAPTLKVLALLLRRSGHHVVTATGVGEALAAADGEAFDGVISDLGLPDGTGLELMQELRERHQLRGIALSGYGMREDISRSHAAGFDAHLIKPVDFGQLSSAIAEWGKE